MPGWPQWTFSIWQCKAFDLLVKRSALCFKQGLAPLCNSDISVALNLACASPTMACLDKQSGISSHGNSVYHLDASVMSILKAYSSCCCGLFAWWYILCSPAQGILYFVLTQPEPEAACLMLTADC